MLYLSALLASKRFRDKGNQDGAVRAIKMLEEAGIGRVLEDKPPRGASIVSLSSKTLAYKHDSKQETHVNFYYIMVLYYVRKIKYNVYERKVRIG